VWSLLNRLKYHHEIFMGARSGQKLGRRQKLLLLDAPADLGGGGQEHTPLFYDPGSFYKC